MERVVLTPGSETSFQGFRLPLEVCDAQGKSVGLFLPLDTYKKWLSHLEIPYSAEELERRRQEQGGMRLQEFWRQLGQS
jgi:hypothetical protein